MPNRPGETAVIPRLTELPKYRKLPNQALHRMAALRRRLVVREPPRATIGELERYALRLSDSSIYS